MNAPLTTEERYRIGGMDCAACAAKIDRAVRRIDGVVEVSVSVAAGTMTVSRRSEAAIAPAVTRDVAALGYRAALIGGAAEPERQKAAHDHQDHDHHDHDGHDHGDHDHGDYDHAEHDHAAPAEDAMPAGLHGHDDEDEDGVAWWRTGKARLTIAAAAG